MKKILILASIFALGAASAFAVQSQTATYRFVRKFTDTTQNAADRKLAAYLAPYIEQRGRQDLCEKNPDLTCKKNGKGEVIYDLGIVSAALEDILDRDIDGAAKERLKQQRIEAARTAAETEHGQQEKPVKN